MSDDNQLAFHNSTLVYYFNIEINEKFTHKKKHS